MITIDPNQFYTIPEVMAATKGSRKSIYAEINEGRLKSIKRGRRRFCTGQQIIDYRKMLEAEAENAA